MRETRLAAVMFTDIAGFSRMMEEDEKRTIDLLDEHNAIIFPLVDNFRGRIVDAIGDGLLITFDSVFSAVSCGLNIQNAVQARNVEAPETPFWLRIGIHMGDIWIEDRRVYGNGVNIASRLQGLARPGGICISEDVYRQIKNKDVLKVEKITRPGLKNISREMDAYHLITGCESMGDLRRENDPRRFSDKDAEADNGSKTPYGEEFSHEGIIDKADRLGERIGSTLEKGIGKFVERTLDMALGAWENTPEETKDNLRREMRDEDWYVDLGDDSDDRDPSKSIARSIRDTLVDGDIRISDTGNGTRRRITIDTGSRTDKGDENGTGAKAEDNVGGNLATLLFGFVASGGFATALYFHDWTGGWFWFLFFLLGILPLTIGGGELIRNLFRRSKRKLLRLEEIERLTLRCAKNNGGRLTVVQLAACAGLTMEESQKELDRLSARGWVHQEIDGEGIIRYEFPALLPER